MDGISTLYAPSGKFALYEFLKVAGAACLALLLTALEPERPAARTLRRHGAGNGGALVSLVSIDTVSTQLLSQADGVLHRPVRRVMQLNTLLQEQRLKTIFENPNVFAGAARRGHPAVAGSGRRCGGPEERCLHLSCLLLNSTAFLLAVSRGAMAAIAAAFLLYLLMERGQRRAVSFILMVETLVLAAAASLARAACLRCGGGEGTDPAPAGRCGRSGGPVRTGHLRGPSAGPAHGPAVKTVNIVLLAALALVAARRGTGGELDRPHRHGRRRQHHPAART